MSISPRSAILHIASSKIPPDPDLTHPWSSVNWRRHSRTRVRAVQSLVPVIPSPSIPTYPSSPSVSRGLILGLDLSRIFGIAADAPRCAWARIRQDCLGRLKSCARSGHSSRPPICFVPCETYEGSGFNCPYLVGCRFPKAEERARTICVCDACCLAIPHGV